MKAWIKALIGISLSFMCLFTCIGFALLSRDMMVFGSVDITPFEPEGLYISNVTIHSVNGVSANSAEVLLPTSVQTSLQVNAPNATVTFEITVHNKTDVAHWYLGAQSLPEGAPSNSLINTMGGIYITTMDNATANSTRFDTADWIPPQTQRVFYATYTFGANAQGSIINAINFKFGLHMQSFSDSFLKVLNDKESIYGYYYLANAFDEQYAESGSTVVGNIGEDEEIFNNLFSSSLSIDVNGTSTPVTVLVERKDIDKNASSGDSYAGNNAPFGCEYTVYLTVDHLENEGEATVYAVSYTCGSDGTWYQIGELYEGSCTISDYDSTDDKYEGAFTVGSWEATTKVYQVTDDISYKVGSQGTGTTSEMMFKLEDLMSVKDNDFYNLVNNNSSKLLKPVCNILYSYTHRPDGRYDESLNPNNFYKEGYTILKAAFDEMKPYCLIENGAQNVRIENAQRLTRAELIPMLERIQQAYDYYLSINPNG